MTRVRDTYNRNFQTDDEELLLLNAFRELPASEVAIINKLKRDGYFSGDAQDLRRELNDLNQNNIYRFMDHLIRIRVLRGKRNGKAGKYRGFELTENWKENLIKSRGKT